MKRKAIVMKEAEEKIKTGISASAWKDFSELIGTIVEVQYNADMNGWLSRNEDSGWYFKSKWLHFLDEPEQEQENKPPKLKDLKNGWIVQCRSEKFYVVIKNGRGLSVSGKDDYLLCDDGYAELDYFDNDLKSDYNNDIDIMKVWNTGSHIGDLWRDPIWERKE